jgi:integrase
MLSAAAPTCRRQRQRRTRAPNSRRSRRSAVVDRQLESQLGTVAETEKAEQEKRTPELLVPITLHEARHTVASLMIAAGVNAKALSTYMGHSSVTITYDRYGHLMPGNENEAASLLDAYLKRAEDQTQALA